MNTNSLWINCQYLPVRKKDNTKCSAFTLPGALLQWCASSLPSLRPKLYPLLVFLTPHLTELSLPRFSAHQPQLCTHREDKIMRHENLLHISGARDDKYDANPATWTEAVRLVALSFGADTPTLTASLTMRQEKSWENLLSAGSWLWPFNNNSLRPHVIWGKKKKKSNHTFVTIMHCNTVMAAWSVFVTYSKWLICSHLSCS